MGIISRARSRLRKTHTQPKRSEDATAGSMRSPLLPELKLPSPKLRDELPDGPCPATPESGLMSPTIATQILQPSDVCAQRAQRRQSARLPPEEILPLLRLCAQQIKTRDPQVHFQKVWRRCQCDHDESLPEAEDRIIDTFLSHQGAKDVATLDPSRDLIEQMAFASVHDVVAVYKWCLRHVFYPEGFSPSTSENGTLPWAWYEHLRLHPSSTEPAYNKVLLPLLPEATSQMLETILETAASVVAFGESNGMSLTTISRILGFWAFGGAQRSHSTADALIEDISKASDAFELVFRLYLNAQKELPLRLKELAGRASPAKDLCQQLRATLSGMQPPESILGLLQMGMTADIQVDTADQDAIAAWTEVNGNMLVESIVDDECRRALAAEASDRVRKQRQTIVNSPGRRRSLTLEPNRSTRHLDARLRNYSHDSFDLEAKNERLPLSSWSHFSSSGFSASSVDLGFQKADTISSGSNISTSMRTSHRDLSAPVGRTRSEAIAEERTLPNLNRIISLSLSTTDAGLVDVFLDAVEELDIRRQWPIFAFVRLRKPLQARGHSICLLLIDFQLFKPASGPGPLNTASSLAVSTGSTNKENRLRDLLALNTISRRNSRNKFASKQLAASLVQRNPPVFKQHPVASIWPDYQAPSATPDSQAEGPATRKESVPIQPASLPSPGNEDVLDIATESLDGKTTTVVPSSRKGRDAEDMLHQRAPAGGTIREETVSSFSSSPSMRLATANDDLIEGSRPLSVIPEDIWGGSGDPDKRPLSALSIGNQTPDSAGNGRYSDQQSSKSTKEHDHDFQRSSGETPPLALVPICHNHSAAMEPDGHRGLNESVTSVDTNHTDTSPVATQHEEKQIGSPPGSFSPSSSLSSRSIRFVTKIQRVTDTLRRRKSASLSSETPPVDKPSRLVPLIKPEMLANGHGRKRPSFAAAETSISDQDHPYTVEKADASPHDLLDHDIYTIQPRRAATTDAEDLVLPSATFQYKGANPANQRLIDDTQSAEHQPTSLARPASTAPGVLGLGDDGPVDAQHNNICGVDAGTSWLTDSAKDSGSEEHSNFTMNTLAPARPDPQVPHDLSSVGAASESIDATSVRQGSFQTAERSPPTTSFGSFTDFDGSEEKWEARSSSAGSVQM